MESLNLKKPKRSMKGIGDVPAPCRSFQHFLKTISLSSAKCLLSNSGEAEHGLPTAHAGFPCMASAAHPCTEQLCPFRALQNHPMLAHLGASTFFLGEYTFSKSLR